MQIKSLLIKNFRSYRKETKIVFDDLTTLIGKNDIGKSTILEALDIFFNDGDGAVKLDKNDLNKDAQNANDTDIVIAVEFCNLPEEIIIDETNKTTLEKEYLLNSKGLLTIVKHYPNGGKAKIYIKANHPTNSECSDLLTLKQSDLKKKVEKLQLNCDKTKNAEIRKAIWNYYHDELNLKEVEILTSEPGMKDIYSKLSLYFPLYSLFQADRSNSDKDKEAQDPMKEAVKIIMGDNSIKQKCHEIAGKVTEELRKVTAATLEKLREMNGEVADSLEANIPSEEDLKWTDVFKTVTLSNDNGIPLNKRGSGVKRLVLLNFFRAEAERVRQERNHPSVIYAIEEPETSQHFHHQKLLMNSLKSLSCKDNIQVILTTHSSYIVKQLKYSNLRLITNMHGEKCVGNVPEGLLPYVSMNEINFVAFGDYSVEYHNELYGFIQSKCIDEEPEKGGNIKDFEKWLVKKGCCQSKQWIREFNGIVKPPVNVTLFTFVRNVIHHPENKHNEHYSSHDLVQSINEMRDFIINNI